MTTRPHRLRILSFGCQSVQAEVFAQSRRTKGCEKWYSITFEHLYIYLYRHRLLSIAVNAILHFHYVPMGSIKLAANEQVIKVMESTTDMMHDRHPACRNAVRLFSKGTDAVTLGRSSPNGNSIFEHDLFSENKRIPPTNYHSLSIQTAHKLVLARRHCKLPTSAFK
jgi:hypothetical protein